MHERAGKPLVLCNESWLPYKQLVSEHTRPVEVCASASVSKGTVKKGQ